MFCSNLQPEIRDWEPEVALYVDGDGLKFYHAIARHAQEYLSEGGFVAVEMAGQRAKKISAIFTIAGLIVKEVTHDYHRNERHLIARKISFS